MVNQAIVGVCRAADNGSLSLHQCRRPGLASATRSPSLFTENKSIFSARVSFGKPHTTALQDCNSRYVRVQMGTFRRTCVCFDFIFIPVSLWTGVYFLWSRQLPKAPLYLIWNNNCDSLYQTAWFKTLQEVWNDNILQNLTVAETVVFFIEV